MSLNENQKWKINHNIDVAITTISVICLIYLLPVILFISKAFFRGETYLLEPHNWVNFALRTSNGLWFGIINKILSLK